MYSLGTALVLFSTWMLSRALDSPDTHRRMWWGGYVLSATALAYTHNVGLFSIMGQAAYCTGVLIVQWAAGYRKSRAAPILSAPSSTGFAEGEHLEGNALCDPWSRASEAPASPESADRSRVRLAAIAFVIVAVAYLPWARVLFTQTTRAQVRYWTPKISLRTVSTACAGLIAPTNSAVRRSLTSASATLFLIALIALLALTGGTGAWLLIAMTVIPAISVFAVSLVSVPVCVDRYLLYAYMFVLCGVSHLCYVYVPGTCRTLTIGVLAFASLCNHCYYWRSLKSAERPGMAGAAHYVNDGRHSDEAVVVTHPTIYFSARYYLRGIAEPLLFLPKGEIPHYMGGPAIPLSRTVDSEQLACLPCKRIWLLEAARAPDRSQSPTLASDWLAVSHTRKQFPESYFFLAPVSVTAFERQPAGQASQIAMSLFRL